MLQLFKPFVWPDETRARIWPVAIALCLLGQRMCVLYGPVTLATLSAELAAGAGLVASAPVLGPHAGSVDAQSPISSNRVVLLALIVAGAYLGRGLFLELQYFAFLKLRGTFHVDTSR